MFAGWRGRNGHFSRRESKVGFGGRFQERRSQASAMSLQQMRSGWGVAVSTWSYGPLPGWHWTMLRIARRNPTSPCRGEVNHRTIVRTQFHHAW